MSAAEAQEVKNFLLQSDQQFRQLAERHHQLDDRLHQLIEKQYLSATEQFEQVTLKKKKLALKDQMESIVREYVATAQPRLLKARPHRFRGRVCRPAPHRTVSPHSRTIACMRIDPAGWPFIGGAFVVGDPRRVVRRARLGAAVFALLTCLFPLFLPRPRSADNHG